MPGTENQTRSLPYMVDFDYLEQIGQKLQGKPSLSKLIMLCSGAPWCRSNISRRIGLPVEMRLFSGREELQRCYMIYLIILSNGSLLKVPKVGSGDSDDESYTLALICNTSENNSSSNFGVAAVLLYSFASSYQDY